MTTFQRVVFLAPALGLMLGAVVSAAGGARSHLNGPYYDVETTDLQYSFQTGDFTAPAKVHVTRPGLDVVADSAKGNIKAGNAVLRGNVRVHDLGGANSAAGKNSAPATLTCEQLDVDGRADTYHATGRPHYESGTRSADADDMQLDRKHKQLHLSGNVTIKDDGRTGTSDTVDVDLKTDDVHMHGAPVDLRAPASAAPTQPPAPRARPAAKATPRATSRPAPRPSASPT